MYAAAAARFPVLRTEKRRAVVTDFSLGPFGVRGILRHQALINRNRAYPLTTGVPQN
ncbi:hypothetical protein HMPREF0578_1811 [Mobiluncus mulieris 28-1]|uniref:Uncharacterized protein n=2 Tax=Mobiluncus mulieris TaxID=2052 RepID=E0QSY0_9ACTO|nr:hypothetical protein HMPREF0578_1811 [Mobiluncus mulieris 28-1]EFM45319.1 hypothetical protein HMPREF0580_2008 [Mobiluncus mulieris ATCC 35239]MCU9994248.1 methyltransferase [Mobiluncus mulieris]MCV0014029.1 methyltransferase [Mobiluncus mulieris]NMW63230.1 methyltransferase [Mobiluncus mulieris]